METAVLTISGTGAMYDYSEITATFNDPYHIAFSSRALPAAPA